MSSLRGWVELLLGAKVRHFSSSLRAGIAFLCP